MSAAIAKSHFPIWNLWGNIADHITGGTGSQRRVGIKHHWVVGNRPTMSGRKAAIRRLTELKRLRLGHLLSPLETLGLLVVYLGSKTEMSPGSVLKNGVTPAIDAWHVRLRAFHPHARTRKTAFTGPSHLACITQALE